MKLRLAAPKMKYGELYPQFAPLTAAVRNKDWSAIEAHWATLPPDVDGAFAILAAIEAPKCEKFLTSVAMTNDSSSLPRVMLAARYIDMAWEARTALMPQYVSSDQFAVFHRYLQQADQLLTEALGDEPTNALAWSFRVTTARGLELGLVEAHRRYAKVAESGPYFLYAQQTMLQQLCPKWGGNWADVRSFTHECVQAAGPGSLSGGLVAAGYIEYVRAEIRGDAEQAAYYRLPAVQAEIDQAALGSVLNPAYKPVPGWVWAHSCFGYVHWRARLDAKAAVHFRILDNRAGKYPWNFHGDRFGDIFLGARNESIRRAK